MYVYMYLRACVRACVPKYVYIARLHPRSPQHLARQTSARVPQTRRSFFLSHLSAAVTYADGYCTAPFCRQILTDLRPHDFTHFPGLWHQARPDKAICTWSLVGLICCNQLPRDFFSQLYRSNICTPLIDNLFATRYNAPQLAWICSSTMFNVTCWN